MQVKVIVALIFAIIISLFAVLNSDVVEVNLLFTSIALSQAIVILVSVCVGAIIMYGFNTFSIVKLKKRIKSLEKDIDTKDSTINLDFGDKDTDEKQE